MTIASYMLQIQSRTCETSDNQKRAEQKCCKRVDLHAIQQCAEDNPRFHHHAPTPEQAELTTSQEQHQPSCLVEADQGAAPSPCSQGQYYLITFSASDTQPVICSAMHIETHGSMYKYVMQHTL